MLCITKTINYISFAFNFLSNPIFKFLIKNSQHLYSQMAMKVVLKLHVHDEREKKKAMKSVSSLSGILSLAMDMEEKKLTVVGDVDPIKIVGKLKKHCHVELLTVGPSKEPEKKKEEKKEENKISEPIEELMKLYKNHFPHYTEYYRVYSAEENPNSCVIC